MNLGLIMAPFKHSWQDGSAGEKSWVLSLPPSLPAYPLFVSYRLLVFLCRVVSKSSSQLLSLHPPNPLALMSDVTWAPLSLLPCSQTPVWTHVSHSGPSLYSRKDSYWDSYCLFALFMLVNSLRANGSVMQSFTFAVHSVLLSIRLMMFSVRRWVPCPLKSPTWERGCKGGVDRPWLNWSDQIPVSGKPGVPLSNSQCSQKMPLNVLVYGCCDLTSNHWRVEKVKNTRGSATLFILNFYLLWYFFQATFQSLQVHNTVCTSLE